MRLYTKADFDGRRLHDDSEIRRLDLTQTLLELAAAGIAVGALPWFEAPPPSSLEAARTLLRLLGAIDACEAATPDGRRMASLPVHPRLARLALEADKRGAGREGCALAALLGERELRERTLFGASRATTSHDSDAVDTLELFLQWQSRGGSSDAARSLGLQLGAAKNVERARGQLERALRPAASTGSWRERDMALRQALLSAFPDRVGKRRTPGGRDLVLSGGGAAQLAESSGVHQAALVVTVDAEERREGTRGGIVVRSASAIEEEWLLEVGPDALGDAIDVQWHEGRERAEAVSRMTYGAIVLDERPMPDADPALLSPVLLEAAKAKGIRAFTDAERIDKLLGRVRFAAKAFPESGIAEPTDDALDQAVAKLCEGRRSFAELREANLESELAAALGADARLDRLAPESVVLPGGRQVKVNYDGHAPWIESRLQDFFGMRDGPKLGGRVPLVLHLLAPNDRAQQVTTDLAGFWSRHYPAVRKELMRQYPRHSWPEDPLTAAPPVPKGR